MGRERFAPSERELSRRWIYVTVNRSSEVTEVAPGRTVATERSAERAEASCANAPVLAPVRAG